jgi:coiled-coil domain-containing protein 130
MQGYNKYYAPEHDDDKRTLNQLAGKKHPLGARGRKYKEGVIVVRFELPFDVYCAGCERRFAEGTRYNAQKSKSGDYLSIPIWNFRLKCSHCGNSFVIQTDPQNADYVVHEGARKAAQPPSALPEVEREPEDPITKLERDVKRQTKLDRDKRELDALYKSNSRQWDDTLERSQALRSHFRKEKHELQQKEEEMKKLQDKHSLSLPLLEPNVEDDAASSRVEFQDPVIQQAHLELKQKKTEDIFSARTPTHKPSRIQSLMHDAKDGFDNISFKRRKMSKQPSKNTPLVDYTSDD